MRFVWGIGSIALVVATAFVLAASDFLLVDGLYAVLAGAIVGVFFVVASMIRGGSADAATRLLFFSVAGSIGGFAAAWVMALVLGVRLMSNAALAFDLAAGAIGAVVLTATMIRPSVSAE